MCSRDYPEYIDVRVYRSNNLILEDFPKKISVSVSESAIITLKDMHTLDSNKRYTAEIFFKNPNGDFNVSGAVNFSEWLQVKLYIPLYEA